MGLLGKLIHKIRYILVVLYSLVRRALCCLKRKQRASETELEPLGGVVVQAASSQDWSDWENARKPVDPVKQKIDDYRAHLQQALHRKDSSPEENEPEIDYFSDLRPACADQIPSDPLISLPKRYSQPRSNPNENRLSFNPDSADPVLGDGAELGEWTEEAQCDWEIEEDGSAMEDKRPRRGRVREKSANASTKLIKR